MTPPKYQLRTFGGLSLTGIDESKPILTSGRKRLVLLAVLCAEPSGAVPRERLLALLWPEVDDLRARNALKQLVYTLRRELDQDLIGEAHGALSVQPDRLTSDVQEFRSALSRGDLSGAAAVYAGPFLDGVYLREAPEFEQWVDARRREFASQYAASLEQLAMHAMSTGSAAAAVPWARALAAAEPLNGRAAQLFIKALAHSGDRAGAIQYAERHAELLQNELGVEPDVEIQGMLRGLRDRTETPPRQVDSIIRPSVAESLEISHNEETATPAYSSWRSRRGLLSAALLLMLGGAGIVGINAAAAARPPKTGLLTRLTLAQSAELDPALSPDGRWLAYTAPARGDERVGSSATRIWLQPLTGGAAIALTPHDSTQTQEQPSWSPDGNRIAFLADSAVIVAPAFGGPLQRVVGEQKVLSVGGWSHDGHRIAYTDSAGIWIYDFERGRSRLVTRTGFGPRSAVWSADDETLAFVVGTGDPANAATATVWVAPVEGGPAIRVSDSLHMNISPAFWSKRRGIIYVSDRDGARDVYFQPLDRANQPRGAPARLTTGSNATDLTISADGTYLVYASAKARSNMWSAPIRREGSVPDSLLHQLTFGDQEVECLSLSRDRRWLIYDSNRSGNQDIYRMPVTGGDPVQLTRHAADDFCGVLSPDGSEIVFYSFRDGYRRLYMMRPDGADQQPIRSTSSTDQVWWPSWSPDGRRILFTIATAGNRKHGAVVSREPNGGWSQPHEFSGFETSIWSPDGRYFAATSDSGLVLVSAQTGRGRVLVPRERLGRWYLPGWGPDPSLVYYHSIDGDPGFWSIPISGGKPTLIMRPSNPGRVSRRIEFATDGRQIFFTLSTDEASIWRLALEQ